MKPAGLGLFEKCSKRLSLGQISQANSGVALYINRADHCLAIFAFTYSHFRHCIKFNWHNVPK